MMSISKDKLKLLTEDLIKAIKPPVLYPEKGISSVITFTQPKLAALFFDRVWNFSRIPETIQLYCSTYLEDAFLLGANTPWIRKKFKGTKEMEDVFEAFDISVQKEFIKQLGLIANKIEINPNESFEQLIKGFERAISESIYRKTGIAVPEMYSTQSDFEESYCKGNVREIVTCLNNIDVADEDHLEWEQVLEFRKDDNARGKLKRLFHWFNSSFVGKSQDYIQYEVSKLLQDYQVSLEIHGIKTKKGVIKSVLDSKNLLLTIGSSAIAGTIIGDLPALFTAVGTLVGNCTISIMESIIEKKEYQNQNVEIAFIHELKEKFSN